MEVPGQQPIVTRTLASAQTLAARRLEVPFDLQVDLGGLEDLCADAVELGERSDALTIQAIRARRIAARALAEAGIRGTDIAFLMGMAPYTAKLLLSVPIDTLWMATGQAPPRRFPRPTEPSPSASATRPVTAIRATRDGIGWLVHLDTGRPPVRRISLAHAEKLARAAIPDADVMLCPELPDELERAIRGADLATAGAEERERAAYELRRDVARRLRDLGIGYADIGQLLGINGHRVRLLLSGGSSRGELVVEDPEGPGKDA